jgi:hypothetical protein
MSVSSPCRRFAKKIFLLLAKELPRERVHKMDLPAHNTGHWLIRIGIVRNRFGGQSLNTDPTVWAALDKSGHRATILTKWMMP